MIPSDNFFTKLIELEGLKLKAYKDSAGIPTIGIGTIIYPDGRKVQMGDTCTEDEAIGFSQHDSKTFTDQLNGMVTNQNQNQFDALLLLEYNIGASALRKSTVLKRIKTKQGDIHEAWLMCNKAGGKVVQGLINRREKEYALYITPVV